MKPRAYMPTDEQIRCQLNLRHYAGALRTADMDGRNMIVRFPDGGWVMIDPTGANDREPPNPRVDS